MRLRLLSVLLGLTALTGGAMASAAQASTALFAQEPAPGGVAGTTFINAIDVGGVPRVYRLFVPSVMPTGPRPLLVALHSFTSKASAFEKTTGLDAGGAKLGALVLYPDGLNNSWNAGACCGTSSATNVDDVSFIAAAIQDVAASYPVDRRRTAVIGGSNGGMMAYRFVCERSDLVDVAEVMSGAFLAPSCSFTRPVSLLHIHGVLDATVPYLGGTLPWAPGVVFPNTKGPVSGFAAMDGCKGATTAPFNLTTTATLWQASSCPPGTYVWLISSAPLGHFWATGPEQTAQYGVDMTGTSWGFLQGVWTTRGAPTAL